MNDPPLGARARELLSCLGEASRYRLVGALSGGQKCVGELALAIGLSQSCTTRHLQALERAGIVCGRREGRRVYFRLMTDPGLDPLLRWALESGAAAPRAVEEPRPIAMPPSPALRRRTRTAKGAGAARRAPVPPEPEDAPSPPARPGDLEDYLL